MSVRPISEQALGVLSTAAVEGCIVKITAGQLPRALYIEVNKALEALGGKWNRREQGHVFEGLDPAERLAEVLDSGGYLDRRKAMQFFETPPELAARLVQLADLRPGMDVLESSAGRGAILRALPTDALVDAMELDPQNIPHLEALRAERPRSLINVLELDFMDTLPVATYDRVVMNPPFSRGQDRRHIQHAHGFLRPGGRLVAVASAGVEIHQDRAAQEFRAWVGRQGGSITRLPERSFRASGTDVSTVLVQVPA